MSSLPHSNEEYEEYDRISSLSNEQVNQPSVFPTTHDSQEDHVLPHDPYPVEGKSFFQEIDENKKKRQKAKKGKYLEKEIVWIKEKIFKPVTLADYTACILWYHLLCVIQWILLNIIPVRIRQKNTYKHLFEYPSSEEGRKAEEYYDSKRKIENEENIKLRKLKRKKGLGIMGWPLLAKATWSFLKKCFFSFWFPKRRPFIVIVDRIERKFMISADRRYRILKTIYIILVFSFIFFFSFQYMTHEIEKVRYVIPESIHDRSGVSIKNILSVDTFSLYSNYGHDQEWLLYQCERRPRITTENIRFGYIEVETPKFGMVNISIQDISEKMKKDSREKGLTLPQPCICGAHYGLPINIILLRDYEFGGKSLGSIGGEEAEKGINNRILYEPTIVQTTSDSVKGTISIDSLVVNDKKLRKLDGFTIQQNVPISPMDNLRILYMQKEYTKEIENAIETYTYPEEIFSSIVDLTEKPVYASISKWISGRFSIPLKKINDKTNGEVTMGYEHIVVRALKEDGSKSIAISLHSPYSICVQRCISSIYYKEKQN